MMMSITPAIKSFVRRTSRFTEHARANKARLWPEFGIELKDEPFIFPELFQRDAPLVLEIGFGMGISFIAQAKKHPELNFLGIEVHTPGVAKVLKDIETEGLSNVRLIEHDAVEVLKKYVKAASVETLQVFFPDPWPKKRHHKRRLVSPLFLDEAFRILKPKGKIHLATDWQPYAEEMLTLLQQDIRFMNQAVSGAFSDRGERPLTKFEMRGHQLGHGVFDLVFVKCDV